MGAQEFACSKKSLKQTMLSPFFHLVFVENDDNNVFNGKITHKKTFGNDEAKKDNMKIAHATYRCEE